ncbi:peptide deformylase [Kitasatospora viridis]|uniref:Peptide deformylase n=1 Tax=Kitasatospora viridis TaxID=281105 RepID=A0A561T6W6_9ACTN|nr:peptide deformylase [Kitasatospora viridis]TWF82839.1 peptide deformylase [Kitasatospora viridis]
MSSPTPSRPTVLLQGSPVPDHPVVPPTGEVLRITEVGEQVLHRRCREAGPADFGSPELAKLVDDMFATMYVAEGVGLAANQVGVDLRLFVYDCYDEEGVRHVGHVLNPVLEPTPLHRRRLVEEQEGCLSVPGANRPLVRPDHSVLHGVDQHGQPVTIEGTGYFARCLQHETDHLLGRLYLDRLGKRDRLKAMRQCSENRETVFAERAARADQLDLDRR